MFIDARIPVAIGVQPGPQDALLQTGPDWASPHPLGCACCVARGPAAIALHRLFLDRVHGRVPWFTRVVAPDDAAGLIAAALADPVVSGRFRPE